MCYLEVIYWNSTCSMNILFISVLVLWLFYDLQYMAFKIQS